MNHRALGNTVMGVGVTRQSLAQFRQAAGRCRNGLCRPVLAFPTRARERAWGREGTRTLRRGRGGGWWVGASGACGRSTACWCEPSFAGTALPQGPLSCWGGMEEAAVAAWGQTELAEFCLHSLTPAAVFSAPGCAHQPPRHAAAALMARGRQGAARLGWWETPASTRHPGTPSALPTPGWGALQSPVRPVGYFGLS